MFIKEIQPLEKPVTFLKIDNKIMSKIYRKITAIALSCGLTLDSDSNKILNKLSEDEVDYIRDIFFEHMICEGYGQNLLKGYDILCEKHGVLIEVPLIVEAFKFYLLEQFKLAVKDGGALASLKNILPQEVAENIMKKMSDKMNSLSSGIL